MEKPENVVREIEEYLKTARVDTVVRDLTVSVLRNKPSSIEQHMAKHLITKVKASDGELAIASSDSGLLTAFAHPDAASQQYLVQKGIHELFLELLQRLGEEKPDDVAGFITEHLNR